MDNPLISLKKYLEKGKPFLIPYYQRGYVWGKSRNSEKDSVQFFIESIKSCYQNNPQSDLFLQGVTVSENKSIIEVIDGQQRTTALYLLLTYLGYSGEFVINYSIRSQSNAFINQLQGMATKEIIELCLESKNEEFQDIYFFKKTIRIIHAELSGIDKSSLIKFLIDDERVKFLFIDIPIEKATTVFSMMNGNKAEMKYEEIIKAEMLRLVSNRINNQDVNTSESDRTKQDEALRWDQNLIRSKYAREWDKWLYWWNRLEVKEFYQTTSVMGLLIETYFKTKHPKSSFNFDNFRDKLLRGSDNTYLSKNVFYELRQLQKKFEDIFNSYEAPNEEDRLHNKVGAIIVLLNPEDRKRFIRSYFVNKQQLNINEYLRWVYLGLNFSQIEKLLKKDSDEKEDNILQEKLDELLMALSNDNLYWDGNEHAFIQLLRRNIEEDTKLRRKFDFSIWKERSLEHIYPKSKVYYIENGLKKNGGNILITDTEIDVSYIKREDFENNGSEHCIGNLVLLYKNENSGFGAKDFNEKKSKYFDLADDIVFRSRHLLHSISVFANEKWGILEIQNNKTKFINEVKAYYGIQ